MGSNYSHSTYRSSNKDHHDGHTYSGTFEEKYFGAGVSRYAFKGTLYGDGPRNNSACAAKVFKSEYAKNFDKWVPDLAASKKADKFAQAFNQSHVPQLRNFCRDSKNLEYIIPLIAKMKEVAHFKLFWLFAVGEDTTYVKPQEYVALEPFLEGNYEKFNSNGGWEVSSGRGDLLNTFSHWSWSKSGHKFMICDIQGINRRDRYLLTDPAVHSYEQIYGPTDLGVAGMIQVLGNHNCNRLCRELGLSNPLTGVSVPSGRKSTTYSFQLTEEQKLRNMQHKTEFFKIMPALLE